MSPCCVLSTSTLSNIPKRQIIAPGRIRVETRDCEPACKTCRLRHEFLPAQCFEKTSPANREAVGRERALLCAGSSDLLWKWLINAPQTSDWARRYTSWPTIDLPTSDTLLGCRLQHEKASFHLGARLRSTPYISYRIGGFLISFFLAFS